MPCSEGWSEWLRSAAGSFLGLWIALILGFGRHLRSAMRSFFPIPLMAFSFGRGGAKSFLMAVDKICDRQPWRSFPGSCSTVVG